MSSVFLKMAIAIMNDLELLKRTINIFPQAMSTYFIPISSKKELIAKELTSLH